MGCKSKTVHIIQISPFKWELRSYKGHTMVDNLMFQTTAEATEWCKAYISSFNSWTYDVITLKETK